MKLSAFGSLVFLFQYLDQKIKMKMRNTTISTSSDQKKIAKLTEDEVSYYSQETLFTGHEILQLHKVYRNNCLSDASVEKEKFVNMFSVHNKSAKALLFLDHVFRTWDFEHRGNLS